MTLGGRASSRRPGCLPLTPLTTPRQIALVLIDEVHLLHEAGRGSSLEAGTVCRIKMLAELPEMAAVRQQAQLPACPAALRCASPTQQAGSRRLVLAPTPRPLATPCRQAPVRHVRFVAVSATIPNIGDIAAWIHAPPGMVRSYGSELRPVPLTTHVKVRGGGWGRSREQRRPGQIVWLPCKVPASQSPSAPMRLRTGLPPIQERLPV